MKKLIIISGLPGAGKTTLAAELSRRTGLFCIHKDTIKENLFTTLCYSGEEESKNLGRVSMELLFTLTKEQLERGVSIIIEAPFYFEDEYPRIDAWSERFGYKIYTIICAIDHEERLRRKANRLRHVAHYAGESGTAGAYLKIPGERLEIKTDQELGTLVGRVMKFIQ